MFCSSCGCKMEETDRFCPACGAKNEPMLHDGQPSRDPTKVYGAPPTRGYAAEPTKEYAPRDSRFADEDVHTTIVDGYEEQGFAEPFAPPLYDRVQPSVTAPPEKKEPVSYEDSFTAGRRKATDYRDSYSAVEDSRFGESGWEDRSRSTKSQYHPTTALRRFGSVILCLLMLFFGFLALMIGSSRIAFSESNVRNAYGKGTLADLMITTKDGEKRLAAVLAEGALDSKTNQPIYLEEEALNRFLKENQINNFAENLTVDFTQFFIFGRTPTLLNSKEITGFLRTASRDVGQEINYLLTDADIDYLGKRIDGGDLSFLSVDENGGAFQQKYGYNPNTIPAMFSVWSLIICAGLALLCIVMIFVINHGNFPAGLSFSSTTMMIFGILNTLIAAGMLVLSYVRNIFLASELLRSFALAMGAISLIVLVFGIIFAVIKTVLRNRI